MWFRSQSLNNEKNYLWADDAGLTQQSPSSSEFISNAPAPGVCLPPPLWTSSLVILYLPSLSPLASSYKMIVKYPLSRNHKYGVNQNQSKWMRIPPIKSLGFYQILKLTSIEIDAKNRVLLQQVRRLNFCGPKFLLSLHFLFVELLIFFVFSFDPDLVKMSIVVTLPTFSTEADWKKSVNNSDFLVELGSIHVDVPLQV